MIFIDSTNQAINLSVPWHFTYTQSINQSIDDHLKISFLPELLRSPGCDSFSAQFWVMRKGTGPWNRVGDEAEFGDWVLVWEFCITYRSPTQRHLSSAAV